MTLEPVGLYYLSVVAHCDILHDDRKAMQYKLSQLEHTINENLSI
jgi:hypothetical protein